MITFQEQLEPSVKLTWLHYVPATIIDWLHTERRELINDDQLVPAKKLKETPLSAIFNIDAYTWTEAQW